MFDPMSDLASTPQDDPTKVSFGGGAPRNIAPARTGGAYAQDVHSITIRGRQRTFYIDLKQSTNGRFFKVSEKSRGGQKTTIMFDVEDLDKFIEAFQEMKTKL